MSRSRNAHALFVSALVLSAAGAAADDPATWRRSGLEVEGGRPAAASVAGVAAPAGFGIGTPISDGSFEKGPPPASDWSEEINSPTNCPSGIWDWSPEFGAAAPDGTTSYWAGGYCNGPTDIGPIEGWVEQDVTVPPSAPVLVFWYLAARGSADESAGSDVAFIDVDGLEQWSVDVSTAAGNTDDGGANLCYVAGRIDLAAFAGQTVSLRVGLDADATSNYGNVVFDDFTFADLIAADGFECGTRYWSATVP